MLWLATYVICFVFYNKSFLIGQSSSQLLFNCNNWLSVILNLCSTAAKIYVLPFNSFSTLSLWLAVESYRSTVGLPSSTLVLRNSTLVHTTERPNLTTKTWMACDHHYKTYLPDMQITPSRTSSLEETSTAGTSTGTTTALQDTMIQPMPSSYWNLPRTCPSHNMSPNHPAFLKFITMNCSWVNHELFMV